MATTSISKFTLTLALGILTVLGIGCTPKPAAVVESKSAASPQAKKIIVKTLRAKDLNPDDKQIKEWSAELKKSHEIFREVWAHIWEDRLQSPMSVFFEIERMMNAHKNPVDGHFLAKSVHCPGRATEIELQKNQQGVVVGAVFYRLNCAGTGLAAGRTEIARVQKNGRAESWTYYAEFMPRAAGQSMAFLREKITCESRLDDLERMSFLECKNLGQNRDSELHLLFSQFKYQKNSATMVQVEGKKFKLLTTPVCDSDKFCTRLTVPMAGSIEIFEDTVSDLVRQERKKAQVDKERAEELKVAEEAHKKFVAELQKKAGQNPTLSQTLPAGAAMNPSNSIVPGQVMNAPPTGEPQFGQPPGDLRANGGVPSFDPNVVGQDGIAHDPVMEFAHGAPPTEAIDPEEMRQRMGQPEVDVQMIPREASVPIER